MTQDTYTQYNAKAILASIPADRGELFIGYRPIAETRKWHEQFHQILTNQPSRHLSRSVFEINNKANGSVVVEVAECASAQEAVDDLMATLADNQAAMLEPGPESLGPAAFQNPRQAPAALFFVRANLRISILSQCNSGEDVVYEWLTLIQKDLDLSPSEARENLEMEAEGGKTLGSRLKYHFPWKLGPEGWFKFVSEGAAIERGESAGELIIGPSETEVTIQGWVLERDRESYKGSFKLD